MDSYKQIPTQVLAVPNPYNSPQELADSLGDPHMVPATWWLVEFSPGQVATMSEETFRAQYEADLALTPMESFVNTVADLRDSDRMASRRALELEARIAVLEGLVTTLKAALGNQGSTQLTFPTING